MCLPTPQTVGERAAQIRWICAWRDRPGGERWAEKALFSAIATEISNLVTFDTVLCENEQQFGISASQMPNLFAYAASLPRFTKPRQSPEMSIEVMESPGLQLDLESRYSWVFRS